MRIFQKPLIGWGLAVMAALLLAIVMYNAPMSSSKGKGNKAFEGRDAASTLRMLDVNEASIIGPTVRVAWDDPAPTPQPESGIIHARTYRVYRGTSSGSYGMPITTNDKSAAINDLEIGPNYIAVKTVDSVCQPPEPVCADFWSASFSNEIVVYREPGVPPSPTVPPPSPPAPTATVSVPPTATASPRPTATPRPAATVTPTPGGTPGINVPGAVNFVWTVGTGFPTPMPITVMTSNGVNWTSQDQCDWFDTCPQGGQCTSSGQSGGTCLLQPHTVTNNNYPLCILTFSAPGLPNKVTRVTMTRPTPAPSPTPIRTPTPSPTPIRTPTPVPTLPPGSTPCQPCPTCPP